MKHALREASSTTCCGQGNKTFTSMSFNSVGISAKTPVVNRYTLFLTSVRKRIIKGHALI